MSAKPPAAEDRDGDVRIPVTVARRILRILDGLGEAGCMAIDDEPFEPECEPMPEAAQLARVLYEALRPTITVGTRVTDGSAHGTLLALVLFPSGWEAHVDWDDRGVEIIPLDRLSPDPLVEPE